MGGRMVPSRKDSRWNWSSFWIWSPNFGVLSMGSKHFICDPISNLIAKNWVSAMSKDSNNLTTPPWLSHSGGLRSILDWKRLKYACFKDRATILLTQSYSIDFAPTISWYHLCSLIPCGLNHHESTGAHTPAAKLWSSNAACSMNRKTWAYFQSTYPESEFWFLNQKRYISTG